MNRRFVATGGEPYFAFVADNIGDLSTLPGHGVLSVEFDVNVRSLPTQSASADELHALVAYVHDIGTQAPILEVGVTPSGRLKAQAKDGGTWSSGVGFFTGTPSWKTVQVLYTLGVWQVVVDGYDITASGATVAGGGAVYLLPNTGYQSRILLFNGRDGLSRTGASVSRLLVAFITSGGLLSQILQWSNLSGGGSSITPELFLVADVARVPAAPLVAQWYEPLFYHPWGAVPEGSPTDAYSWGLETEYTPIARPVTLYTQVAE